MQLFKKKHYTVDKTDGVLQKFEEDLHDYKKSVLSSYTKAPVSDSILREKPPDNEELRTLRQAPRAQDVEKLKIMELEQLLRKKYEEEINALVKRQRTVEFDLRKKEKELLDKENELKDAQEKTAKKEMQLQKKEQEITLLEKTLEEKDMLLDNKEQDIKSEEELKKNQYHQLTSSINTLLSQKAELQRDVLDMESKLSQMTADYDQKYNAMKELKNLLMKREDDILLAEEQNKRFEETILKKEKEIITRLNEIYEQKELLETKTKTIAEFLEKKESVKEEIKAFKKEVMDKIMSAKEDLLSQEGRSMQRAKKVQEGLTTKQDQLKKWEKTLKQEQKTVEKFQKYIDTANESKADVVQLQKQIKDLQKQYRGLKNWEQAKLSVKEATKHNEQLKSQLLSKEKELDLIESELMEKKQQLDLREYVLYAKDKNKSYAPQPTEKIIEAELTDSFDHLLQMTRSLLQQRAFDKVQKNITELEKRVKGIDVDKDKRRDLNYEVLALRYELELARL